MPLIRRGTESQRTAEDTIELVRRLAAHHPDRQIAAILNKQRRRTGTGLPFTESRVKHVRHKHAIPAAPPPDPASDLVTIDQAAAAARRHAHHDLSLAQRRAAPRRTDHARRAVADPAHRRDPRPLRARRPRRLRSRSTRPPSALGVARQTILHKVQRGELAAVQVTQVAAKGSGFRYPAARLD